ncbi:38663_t:CDS:1, partial [Gigaspora margarita]
TPIMATTQRQPKSTNYDDAKRMIDINAYATNYGNELYIE